MVAAVAVVAMADMGPKARVDTQVMAVHRQAAKVGSSILIGAESIYKRNFPVVKLIHCLFCHNFKYVCFSPLSVSSLFKMKIIN